MTVRGPSFALVTALGVCGCFFTDEETGPVSPCPEGERCDSSQPPGEIHPKREDGSVGVSVEEAWPNRPVEAPPLTALELAQACSILAACADIEAEDGNIEGARKIALSLCAQALVDEETGEPTGGPGAFFWEERAVPALGKNERWTFEARKIIELGGDCAAALAVSTDRPQEINCEEAGCWWTSPDKPIPTVTCDGDVATLVTGSETFERDCSRALTTCDDTSPTGCVDRAPVACEHPADDRCEGTVRLGCDGNGRVSFHDCSRAEGGSCGEVDAEGHLGCVYPDAGECEVPSPGTCEGESMRFCVFGQSLLVDCKALGLGACQNGLCPAL